MAEEDTDPRTPRMASPPDLTCFKSLVKEGSFPLLTAEDLDEMDTEEIKTVLCQLSRVRRDNLAAQHQASLARQRVSTTQSAWQALSNLHRSFEFGVQTNDLPKSEEKKTLIKEAVRDWYPTND